MRHGRLRVFRTWGFVLVIGALVPSCTGGTKQQARPVATSAPVMGFLSVPYADDAGGGHEVAVWNWNGVRQAVVHTGPAIECCGSVAIVPGGKRMQVLDASSGAQLLDLRGHVVDRIRDPSGTWADDGRHQCLLVTRGGPGYHYPDPIDLVLIDPDGTRHTIALVGTNGPHGGPAVVRCSLDSDQAIVATSFMGSVVQVSAVKLSTGRVISPRWLGSREPDQQLALSGDGRYAGAQHLEGNVAKTDIIDTRTDKVVGAVTGVPLAMSWAGRFIVVRRTYDIAVIDWRTHTATWVSRATATGQETATVSARPRSDDLALAVSSQPGQVRRQAALWLVPSRSPARLLDANVLWGTI